MIIDSHSHWLPEKIIQNAHFYSKAWGDIEAQIAAMDAAGIDKAILSYPTSDAHVKLGGNTEVARVFNDAVGAILKKYPSRFIGAAVLPACDSQAMLAELKRAVEGLGFKAISLASSYDGVYLDDAAFVPVYEYAQIMGVPIFVHAQIVNPLGFDRVRDPLLTPVMEYIFDISMCAGKLLMGDVLRRYPKVKFVFAYFGGVTCHLIHRYDATYQMLRGINFVKDLSGAPRDFLKNIYVDTSGDTVGANFLAALEMVGPKHILWGADWPAKKDASRSIQAVKALTIPETEKAGILGKNAESLFR